MTIDKSKRKRDENFSSIPNEVFEGEIEERLNVEELYLYCFLHGHQNFTTNTFHTNFQFLEQTIRFTAHKDRNRKRILQLLKQLQEKEYIFIGNVESEDIFKGELEIILPKKTKETGNFTKIPNVYFEMAGKEKGKEKEFSLLAFIKRKSYYTDAISIEEFREHLLNNNNNKFSDRTIRNHLIKMKEKGIISIVSGKYYERGENGKYRQEENCYTINSENFSSVSNVIDFADMKAVNVGADKKQNKKHNKKQNKKQEILNPVEADALEFYEENIKSANIKVNDYIAIKLQDSPYDNPYLLEICEKEKFSIMEKGGFNFNYFDKAVQKEKNYRKRQQQRNKPRFSSVEELREEIRDYEEYIQQLPEDDIRLMSLNNNVNSLKQQLIEMETKEGIIATADESDVTVEAIEELLQDTADESIEEVEEVQELAIETSQPKEIIKKEAPQENDDWILEMLDEENVIDENDDDFDDDDFDFDEDEDFIVEENHDDYDFLSQHLKHHPEYKKFANMKFMKYMGMN